MHRLGVIFAVVLFAGCGAAATPQPTVPPTAAGGHVVSVNVNVPIASVPATGTRCGASDLEATGPIVTAIPGSRFALMRLDHVGDVAEGTTPRPLETLVEAIVPLSGTVGDATFPDYPATCVFEFEVKTTAEVDLYGVSLGEVYLPIPVIPRDDLASHNWVVDIGVNPQ